jgi:hypothetical protein
MISLICDICNKSIGTLPTDDAIEEIMDHLATMDPETGLMMVAREIVCEDCEKTYDNKAMNSVLDFNRTLN